MNTQILKDYYSVVKAILKQRYPNLTSNDLAYISGREDEVFERVEQRTGVSREEIERGVEEELNAISVG